MNLTELLALGLRLVELALRSGEDVAVVIKIAAKMRDFATPGHAPPTKADFDEIAALTKPYLDALNDTSRDDA